MTVMCQSCVEIDKQVERYRELLRSLTEQVEVERINQLIARLYADRVRLHRNPEQQARPRGFAGRAQDQSAKATATPATTATTAIKACETATAAWKQVSYKRRALIISVISLFAKARLGDHAIP